MCWSRSRPTAWASTLKTTNSIPRPAGKAKAAGNLRHPEPRPSSFPTFLQPKRKTKSPFSLLDARRKLQAIALALVLALQQEGEDQAENAEAHEGQHGEGVI